MPRDIRPLQAVPRADGSARDFGPCGAGRPPSPVVVSERPDGPAVRLITIAPSIGGWDPRAASDRPHSRRSPRPGRARTGHGGTCPVSNLSAAAVAPRVTFFGRHLCVLCWIPSVAIFNSLRVGSLGDAWSHGTSSKRLPRPAKITNGLMLSSESSDTMSATPDVDQSFHNSESSCSITAKSCSKLPAPFFGEFAIASPTARL